MQDSKFWRIVAVVACVGILYVGHGLHNPGGDAAPSFVNSARAGGVAVDPIATNPGGRATRIYTSNESGTVLYVWDAPGATEGSPKHIATVSVPKKDWLP